MLKKMDKQTKEAIRYLGYKNKKPDDQVMNLITEMLESIEKIGNKKSVHHIFELSHAEDGQLKFGNITTDSRNLSKNLKNCDKIVVLAATLGTEVDRLQSRLSVIDMAKAVVLQACAAAVLEEYCDELQKQITEELGKEGYYLRPRFSPGYGDFSIEYQKNIVQMLDCAKSIGLTITDSFMLSPKKSITAVIGMSRTDEKCHQSGCEVCEKIDCEFRRNTE